MENLRQFACTSILRPELSPASFADIVRELRRHSRGARLTGVLAFDGWRLFQYLEGDEAQLGALVESLRANAHHVEFTPLIDAPLAGSRRFSGWRMGYPCADDDMLLARFVALPPAQLLAGLPALVAGLDLEP